MDDEDENVAVRPDSPMLPEAETSSTESQMDSDDESPIILCLPDRVLAKIAGHLPDKSNLFLFARVCRRFRNVLCYQKPDSFFSSSSSLSWSYFYANLSARTKNLPVVLLQKAQLLPPNQVKKMHLIPDWKTYQLSYVGLQRTDTLCNCYDREHSDARQRLREFLRTHFVVLFTFDHTFFTVWSRVLPASN
jgi:hypothetical protein